MKTKAPNKLYLTISSNCIDGQVGVYIGARTKRYWYIGLWMRINGQTTETWYKFDDFNNRNEALKRCDDVGIPYSERAKMPSEEVYLAKIKAIESVCKV